MAILRTIQKNDLQFLKKFNARFGSELDCMWNGFNPIDRDTWPLFCDSKKSKRIISVETPLFGRECFNRGSNQSFFRVATMYSSSNIGFNYGLEALREIPKRLEWVLHESGSRFDPIKKSGRYIVYAMQVPFDTSLRGLDVFLAAVSDLSILLSFYGKRVIVSAHPDLLSEQWAQQNLRLSEYSYSQFRDFCSLNGVSVVTSGSSDLLNDAKCVVCYTSGVGFDALLRCIPVCSLSRYHFLGDNNHFNLDTLDCVDRLPEERVWGWLSKIACIHWRTDEIESSQFEVYLQHLLRRYKEVPA